MGLLDSFCGDTSLHGYQYIGRRERRPLWAGIVISSIILAVYFLGYNISEYMSSFTTTSLQTTTSSLDNIFYPSVTVCNMNQIRQVFNNISAICEEANCSINDIVKLNVSLQDLSIFSLVNEVMSELFTEPYPARAALQVARLPLDSLIEVEAIIVKNN